MSLSALSARATTSLTCIPSETVWEASLNPMVTPVRLKTAQHYIDCTMTDDALLLQYYKLLVSCASSYLVAITKNRVRSKSTRFWSNCRNRCLSVWLMNPLVRSTRLKSYHCLSYHSLRTCQTSSAGPRGVGTAKHEGSATCGRRHSTNIFASQKHPIRVTSHKNNISRRGCGKIGLIHCLENL